MQLTQAFPVLVNWGKKCDCLLPNAQTQTNSGANINTSKISQYLRYT